MGTTISFFAYLLFLCVPSKITSKKLLTCNFSPTVRAFFGGVIQHFLLRIELYSRAGGAIDHLDVTFYVMSKR